MMNAVFKSGDLRRLGKWPYLEQRFNNQTSSHVIDLYAEHSIVLYL